LLGSAKRERTAAPASAERCVPSPPLREERWRCLAQRPEAGRARAHLEAGVLLASASSPPFAGQPAPASFPPMS